MPTGDFKNLLKTTINPSLSNKSKLSIKPQPSISSLYGKVKDHKINYPLRVSLLLIWHILDKILAEQDLEDIIQIS